MKEENTPLVDEYEKLQNLKKELEERIDKIKDKIIVLAQQKDTDTLLGTNKSCSIKEYEKIVYPKDKTQIVELIKKKGLYEQLSSINYFKLGPKIVKNEIDKEIIDLVKKEKAFRVSLRNLT
jgi:hypothetical protein